MTNLYLSSKIAGAKLADRTISENTKIAKNPYNHAMANLEMYRLAICFLILVYLTIAESGKKSGEKHMQRRFLMKSPFQSNYEVSGNLHQAKKLWMQRNQMNVILKKSFKSAPPDFNNLH